MEIELEYTHVEKWQIYISRNIKNEQSVVARYEVGNITAKLSHKDGFSCTFENELLPAFHGMPQNCPVKILKEMLVMLDTIEK